MKHSFIAILVVLASFSLTAGAQTSAPGEPALPGLSGTPVPASTSAPAGQNVFFGGVPTGKVQPGEMPLGLIDAIDRGLKYNLGILIAQEGTRAARGERWKALSDLLPHLTTGTSETREQLNLAALGFPGLPGIPNIVGPFSVFDTRAYLSGRSPPTGAASADSSRTLSPPRARSSSSSSVTSRGTRAPARSGRSTPITPAPLYSRACHEGRW